MKMNLDCVRAVLLYLEENLIVSDDDLSISPICAPKIADSSEMSEYTRAEIVYACKKLFEAGYIDGHMSWISESIKALYICDITYPGFQFLEKIRNPEIYTRTKSKLTKVGTLAFSIVEAIATETIKNHLGLK